MARIEEQRRVKGGMTREECERMSGLIAAGAPEGEKRRAWLEIKADVDARGGMR